MRSIRLSLIIYFLALLAAALGGVSWFVYYLTDSTLRDRQASTENLIESQFRYQCKEAENVLDKRLRTQAQALVSLARWSNTNYEPLNVLSMVTGPALPQGQW